METHYYIHSKWHVTLLLNQIKEISQKNNVNFVHEQK